MQRERAKPLLGTIVSIRAGFDDEAEADGAIAEAFAEIGHIHRLMSFHDPESDVSRVNREALFGPVFVDPRTFEVLSWAQSLAQASDGAFDITAAGLAVAAGALPAPSSPLKPTPDASWRNIELIEAMSAVLIHKPLWIDLGGVAKGYAVDCAISILKARGAQRAVVNAGGDLAVHGPDGEPVWLRGHDDAVIELGDGALASSGGGDDRAPAVHFDIRHRRQTRPGRFVSVVAETCLVADALTKVVMIEGDAAGPVLQSMGATAYVGEARRSWRLLGAAA